MKLVQVPAFGIFMMQWMPVWSKLKAVAHTLPYDLTIMKDFQRGQPLPSGRWSRLKVPTLAMDGGKSPAWMRHGVRAAADAIPTAEYRTLPGQTHMVQIKVLAPVLKDYFLG